MAKSCINCLYSNSHPFGLTFKNGLCSGCLTHLEKQDSRWEQRQERFIEHIDTHRAVGNRYDCIVPVMGDAEDYFVLSKVLNMQLRPLVVGVNSYFFNDIGWHNFHNLITEFDVDSIHFNPEISTYKELVAASLKNFDNIYLPFLQLHTSFPVHLAVEKGIKLIIWGQSQPIEQVGKFSHDDDVKMSAWNRTEHDLFQVDSDKLIGNGAQINTRNLNYYQYPKSIVQNRKDILGLYLSNYFPWDPLLQNSEMLKFGFLPQENQYSFDPYERAGSSVYYRFHDLLKLKKHGYRKITDHLSREVRHNRITQLQAKVIEKEYTQRPVEIRSFFDWIGSTRSGYDWFIKHRLENFKDQISLERSTFEKIELPESIGHHVKAGSEAQREYVVFDKGVKI